MRFHLTLPAVLLHRGQVFATLTISDDAWRRHFRNGWGEIVGHGKLLLSKRRRTEVARYADDYLLIRNCRRYLLEAARVTVKTAAQFNAWGYDGNEEPPPDDDQRISIRYYRIYPELKKNHGSLPFPLL